VKLPPTVFIVDERPAVLTSLEAVLKPHGYVVQCFASAADFISKQDPNQVGCVLIEMPLSPIGDSILRWLHSSGSLLSLVIVSGLIDSAGLKQNSTSISQEIAPFEVSALLTMVADGLAGSLSRKAVRDRGSLKG
jgi:FixJ family two-component response regulator